MTVEQAHSSGSRNVVKTYRYLRIGMIGAVVLLAASIGIEHAKADCWQTSISAYYYTPVRAIFVGVMFAVGFALIVYRGRTDWEDAFLNLAGMLAPVVAVAPTTDVGRCWSVPPVPLPIKGDGSLAEWVTTNIDNNIYALLIAGAIGITITIVIGISERKRLVATVERMPFGIRVAIGAAMVALVGTWWLIRNWSDFDTRAHGWAAVLMFGCMFGAVVSEAVQHRREGRRGFWRLYAWIAAAMFLGGALIAVVGDRLFGDHTVAWLEGYEITLFAAYWIAETVQNRQEDIVILGEPASEPAVPPVVAETAGT